MGIKKISTLNSRLFLSIVVLPLAIGSLSGCFTKGLSPGGGGGAPIIPPKDKGLTGYTQADISKWKPVVTTMLKKETSSSTIPSSETIPWDIFYIYESLLNYPDYPINSGNYYHYMVTFDPLMAVRVKDPILMVFASEASILNTPLVEIPDPTISSPPNIQPAFEKNGRGKVKVYIGFTDNNTGQKFYLTLVPTSLQEKI